MSPNDANGMANNVDPDQTAPLGAVWFGSVLFAQTCLSEKLGKLGYNTIVGVQANFRVSYLNRVILKVKSIGSMICVADQASLSLRLNVQVMKLKLQDRAHFSGLKPAHFQETFQCAWIGKLGYNTIVGSKPISVLAI